MTFHPFEVGVVRSDVRGGAPFPAQMMHQVHGNRIQWVDDYVPLEEADALMTDKPGVTLMVKSADCIPLVFADEEVGLVAAVHAGWRGLTADIVPKTVEEMVGRGAKAERLKVLIGPSLGKECSDFSDPFAEIPASFHWAIEGNLVDLNGICDRQLADAGLRPEHIHSMKICTRCDPSWFSFRRNQGSERFGTWVRLVNT